MAKTNRKAIPKSVRFEVFKRDSFTCQYCGQAAPDVVLVIDHIKPYSKSGDNDIMNLVTACAGCNAGKSDRELDDKSVIAKQKAQLDELNERRLQLEMMLEWREAVSNIAKQQEDAVVEFIDSHPDFEVSPIGRNSIRKWIKRYGFTEVMDAAETSFGQYLEYKQSGGVVPDSWNKAFNYIPRIINVKRREEDKPYIGDLFYIRGILRNRFSYVNDREALDLLERCHLAGASIDSLREFTKTVNSRQAWEAELERFIEEHGGE